jgi:hypothetical protein
MIVAPEWKPPSNTLPNFGNSSLHHIHSSLLPHKDNKDPIQQCNYNQVDMWCIELVKHLDCYLEGRLELKEEKKEEKRCQLEIKEEKNRIKLL